MLCVVVKTTSETLNKFNRGSILCDYQSLWSLLTHIYILISWTIHCCKFYIFSVHPLDKVTNDIAEQ